MNHLSFVLTCNDLIMPWSRDLQPVGFVKLDDLVASDSLHMPSFPLIGLGAEDHPHANRVDAVTDSSAIADRIAQACLSQPEAASILVHVLRLVEGMADGPALLVESLAYAVLQGSDGHGDWQQTRPADLTLASGRVHLSRIDDQLFIRLDRPSAHNAIDRRMRDALREAFELAALDPDIRRIDLRGEGRAFSVGADLSEFGTTRDPARAHAIRMATLPAHALLQCRDRLHVHVQGACVGSGLEMAAFATHITANRGAWFQLPELSMGIIPGAGGCVSLSRRIGRQRAASMILSGQRIGARQALAWGLVDALVDD